MNQSINDKKLPLSFKIGQSLGNAGGNILLLLNSYFLLYVYTDVIQIPAAAASVILLIARVWDAVNDPMMGTIVDNTKNKKEGKCRFWLKYFTVPGVIVFILSYWCPEMAQPAKIAWVAITYILQGMALTVLGVSGNALVIRSTDNSQERMKIQQLEALLNTAVNTMIPAVTLPLAKATGHGNLATGFLIVVTIYALLYGASKFASYFTSKGFDVDPETTDTNTSEEPAGTTEKAEKGSSLKPLITALKSRYVVHTCLIYIFYLLISSFISASMVYYVQYTVGNMSLMSYYSVAAAAGGVVFILLLTPMSKKFGNAKSCAICSLVFAAGELVRVFTHDSSVAVFVILIFFMAGATMDIGSFAIQCIMDACTYERLMTGVNNQAVTMSLFTFGMKAGQAIGGAVVAAMLAMVPYIPQAEEQAESVRTLFFAENVTIPLILALLLAAGFYFVVGSHEKKLTELKKSLSAENQ